MDLKKFNMQVGKIVVYPGSVDELNEIEKLANSGKHYALMPMKGKRYLVGSLIPSPSEIKELMAPMQAGFGALQGMGDVLGLKVGKENSEEADVATGILEELVEGMAKNPAMMKTDIRMKAKEIGANGLVHFQMYSKEGVYMGVPVRLDK